MDAGLAPHIHALYIYDREIDLPFVPNERYRSVTEENMSWLLDHIRCDVQYLGEGWDGYGYMGLDFYCKSCSDYLSRPKAIVYDSYSIEEREI